MAASAPTPAPLAQVLDAPGMAPGEISPKAKMAALFVAVATVVFVVGHTIATGEFNATEVGEAVAGLGSALAAFAGGYTGKPGQVVAGPRLPGATNP